MILFSMWYAVVVLLVNAQIALSVYNLPHYTLETCYETATIMELQYEESAVASSCVYIPDSQDV